MLCIVVPIVLEHDIGPSTAHTRGVVLEPREDSKQLSGQQIDCDLGTVGVQGGQEANRRQAAGGNGGTSILWTQLTGGAQIIASACTPLYLPDLTSITY